MGNLIKMDLYRMVRSKTVYVCLILTFALALAMAPLEKLLSSLADIFNGETEKKEASFDAGSLTGLSEEDMVKVREIFEKYGLQDIEEDMDEESFEAMLKEKGIDEEALKHDLVAVVGNKNTEKQSNGIFDPNTTLDELLRDPFLMFGAMLLMISVCSFFYADVENGYIKNIAGQMPKKGFTIVSKFTASVAHNLIFMAAGFAGNLLGSLLVKHISAGELGTGISIFFLKLLLIQGISAMLVLFVSTFRNKSLGTVVAVVMGLGLMGLMYSLIDTGIEKLWSGWPDLFSKYMPDNLLGFRKPSDDMSMGDFVLASIVVSGLFIAVFLNLAVNLFDKKDVK